MRILKKYPNRRLYDTCESSYVTLDDVKVLVLKHERFKVIDSKSGKNITRSILMQIISEQEAKDGTPIFSDKMLQQLIRFYGDSLQGVMGEYLEKSLSLFLEQQDLLRHQLHNVINANPLKQISRFAEENIPLIRGFHRPRHHGEPPAAETSEKSDKSEKSAKTVKTSPKSRKAGPHSQRRSKKNS
ncbi:MAG: polyhydroxyalkanoate synthesis repressor PhaR [Pseudomonadota bacterium]